MNTTYTFPKLEKKDFDRVMSIIDAGNTATYSLLLANNRTENTAQESYRDKYAKIGSRAYSGKKAEGSAKAAAEKLEYVYVSNMCEIFKKNVEVSDTALVVAKKNGQNIVKDELEASLIDLKSDINSAIVKGELSTEDPRATSGFVNIVDAENVITGEITKENIEAAILKVKKHAKGQIYLAVSTADLVTVQNLFLAGRTINVQDGQDVVAGVAVTKIKSAYGPVVNLYCEDELEAGQVLVFDIKSVAVKVLRDFFQKSNSIDFDGISCEIIAEMGASANPYAVSLVKPAA